jgi:hypothetical protein
MRYISPLSLTVSRAVCCALLAFMKAGFTSALQFPLAGGMPLAAGSFVPGMELAAGWLPQRVLHAQTCLTTAMVAVAAVATAALLAFGAVGARMGDTRVSMVRGALRALIAGWLAMGIAFIIGIAVNPTAWDT